MAIVHKEWDIKNRNRITAGSLNWRSTSRVVCGRQIPFRLKGNFYRAAIRSTALGQ